MNELIAQFGHLLDSFRYKIYTSKKRHSLDISMTHLRGCIHTVTVHVMVHGSCDGDLLLTACCS